MEQTVRVEKNMRDELSLDDKLSMQACPSVNVSYDVHRSFADCVSVTRTVCDVTRRPLKFVVFKNWDMPMYNIAYYPSSPLESMI